MKKISSLILRRALTKAHFLKRTPIPRLVLFFLLTAPLGLRAQPGLQWTSSINVGDGPGNPGTGEDWMLDVIVTSSGNYLGVGWARGIENVTPVKPSYALLTPGGALLRDDVIGTDYGELWNVTEAGNAYYGVGRRRTNNLNKGLLAKINKTTLDYTAYDILPPGYAESRLRDVLNVQSNRQDQYLLVFGFVVETAGGTTQDWMRHWITTATFCTAPYFPPTLTAKKPLRPNTNCFPTASSASTLPMRSP